MGDRGAERVLRSGRIPLALSDRGRRQLMATDVSTSVIRVISTDTGYQVLCYDAYGCDGVAKGRELVLGFNGEHCVPLQKTYVLGNGERFYSPNLRRFCSPDKSGPFTLAGTNGYAYCRGDPINLIDPSGRAGVPNLQFLAGQQLGKMNSLAIKLHGSSAVIKSLDGSEFNFGYLDKRFLSSGMAGLSSGAIQFDSIANKTASFFSRSFDKYMKQTVLENPGLAAGVSAQAVESVIGAVVKGQASRHISISQTLPTSSRGRSEVSLFYTGMTVAHETKLQAALSEFKSNILQTNLPVRRLQPIPEILNSSRVQALLKDIETIRKTYG